MARDCQSGGSARTERSDSPSNAEIASHVGDRIEDYPGIGAPSRDDLAYFIVSNDHVSLETARSWIRTALMAGRIYESQGGELNIIRW